MWNTLQPCFEKCHIINITIIIFMWLREDAAAHLRVDVEVPVGLKAFLLIFCIVEQEAVFDDKKPL